MRRMATEPKYDPTEAQLIVADASLSWKPLCSAELLAAFERLTEELTPVLTRFSLFVKAGSGSIMVRKVDKDGAPAAFVELKKDEMVVTSSDKEDRVTLAVAYSRASGIFEGTADDAFQPPKPYRKSKRSALAVVAEGIVKCLP